MSILTELFFPLSVPQTLGSVGVSVTAFARGRGLVFCDQGRTGSDRPQYGTKQRKVSTTVASGGTIPATTDTPLGPFNLLPLFF